MPIGKRPTPAVAKGKSPSFRTHTGKSYSGTRGTKTPTGSRPVPSVARNTPRSDGVAGGGRVATKPTPMPAPKQAATTKARGKGHGGR